jgi:hypothetical protein
MQRDQQQQQERHRHGKDLPHKDLPHKEVVQPPDHRQVDSQPMGFQGQQLTGGVAPARQPLIRFRKRTGRDRHGNRAEPGGTKTRLIVPFTMGAPDRSYGKPPARPGDRPPRQPH